jgi:hypothetical protein
VSVDRLRDAECSISMVYMNFAGGLFVVGMGAGGAAQNHTSPFESGILELVR